MEDAYRLTGREEGKNMHLNIAAQIHPSFNLSSHGKHFFLNIFPEKQAVSSTSEQQFMIYALLLLAQIVHISALQYFNEQSIFNNLEKANNKTHLILCGLVLGLGYVGIFGTTICSACSIQSFIDAQTIFFSLTVFFQTVFLIYYLYLILWLQAALLDNHSWVIFDLASIGVYYYFLRQSLARYYFQDWFIFLLFFCGILFTFGKTDQFYFSLAELGILTLSILIPVVFIPSYGQNDSKNQIKKKFRHIKSDGPLSPQDLLYSPKVNTLGISSERYSKPEQKNNFFNKKKLHVQLEDKLSNRFFPANTPKSPFTNGVIHSGREYSQHGMPKPYSQMNLSSSAEGSNNCLSVPSRAYFNQDFEAKRELEKKIVDYYEGEEIAMNPYSHSPPKPRKDTGRQGQQNQGVAKSYDNQASSNVLLMQNNRQRYHSTGNNFKTFLNEQQQLFPEIIATTATTLNHHNNNITTYYHPQQQEQSLTLFQDRNAVSKGEERPMKNEQFHPKDGSQMFEGEQAQQNKALKETMPSRPSMQINGKPLGDGYQVEDVSQQRNHFLLNGDLSNILEGEDIFPSIMLDEDCSVVGFAGNIFEYMIPSEMNRQQYQQSQQQRYQNRQQTAKFEQTKRKNSVTYDKADKNDQKSMKSTESPENKGICSSSNAIQELQRLLDTTYVSLLEFYEAQKKHELIQIFLKHDSQSMQINSSKQKSVIHPSFVPSVVNFLENKSHGASPVNSNNFNNSWEDSQVQLSSRGIIAQAPKSTAQLLFGSPALVSYRKAAMTMLSGNPFLVLNTSQNSFSMLRPEDQVPQTQQQVPEPPLSLVKKIPSSLNMLLPNQSLARLENSPRAASHSPKNTIQTLMSIPSDLADQHPQQQDSTRNRQNTHQKTQYLSNTPPPKPYPPRRSTQNSLSMICNIQPMALNNLNGIQIMTHNPTVSQGINSSSINNNQNSNSIPQPSVSSLRIENNLGKIQDEFVNYIFQFEKACNASNLRVIISIILDLEKENLTEQVVYRVLQCKNYPAVPKCASCANQGGSMLNATPVNHKTSTNNNTRFLNVTPSNRKLSDQGPSSHHLSWNMENIAIDIVINPRSSLAVTGKTTTRREKVRVLFRRDFQANFFESVHTMHSSQEEQNKNKAEVLLVKKIFIDSFQSVSHEFGTALNCINNLSDAACSQLSQQSVTTIIKPIRYNSTLIQFLVNDILDHHMILQNTFLLDDQPFSLSALKSELIELFYLQVEYKHLKLEIRVNQNTPDVICADRNRIQSILMTMIRNAIKYTQTGGITVEIKSKHNIQSNVAHSSNFLLIFEVSDTGVGLDEYESNRLRQLLNYGFCNEPISKNSLGNGVGGLCVSNLIAIRLSGKINRGISFTKNPCESSHGTIFSFQVYCTSSLSQRNVYFPNLKTNPSAASIPVDFNYQGNLEKAAQNDWEIASGIISPTPDMANKQQLLINHVYTSPLIHSMLTIERNQAKKGKRSFSENEEKNKSQEQGTLKSREKLEYFVADYSKQAQKFNRERSVSLQERVHSNPQQDKQLNPLEELNEQDDEEQDENNFNSLTQTNLQQHTFIQQLVFEKQISLPTKTKIQDISLLGVSLPAQLTNNPSHWSTHAAAQSVFIQNLSSTTPSSQNNSNSFIPIPLSSQRQYQLQQQSTSAALAKSQRLENIQDENFQVENLMTNLNFFREQGLRESQEMDNSLSTNKNNFSLNSPKISQALSPLLNFGGNKKSLFNHIRTSKNRLTFDSYSFQQLQQTHNLQRTHSNTVNIPSRARNNSSVLGQSTLGSAGAGEKNQQIANILKIPDRTKRTSDPVGSNKSQVTESIVITDGKSQKKIFEPKESSNRVIRSLRPLPLLDTNYPLAESPTTSPNFNIVGYGSSLGPSKYIDAFQFSLKEKDSVLNDNLHSPNRRLSNKSFMNRRSRVTFGGGNPPSLDEEPLKLDRLISKSLESLHSQVSSDQEYPNKAGDGIEKGITLKTFNPHESVKHQGNVTNPIKLEFPKQITFNVESNNMIIETPIQAEEEPRVITSLSKIQNKTLSLPNKSTSILSILAKQPVSTEQQSSDKNTLQTLANQLQDAQILTDNGSSNNNDKKSQIELTIPDEHHDHDPQFEGLYSIPQLEKQSTSSGLSSQCCVKILCVDDEPFNHFVMKAILAPRKLLFDTALDGKQAVTMFQQRKKCTQCGLSSYSLIFMDLNMPVKNGFEATLEIKNLIQLHHTTSKVMIVICSAFIDIASKSKAQQCGSDYFLQKPINSKHLFEFIETHFQI